VGVEQD
jgi:hypothetical protein